MEENEKLGEYKYTLYNHEDAVRTIETSYGHCDLGTAKQALNIIDIHLRAVDLETTDHEELVWALKQQRILEYNKIIYEEIAEDIQDGTFTKNLENRPKEK